MLNLIGFSRLCKTDHKRQKKAPLCTGLSTHTHNHTDADTNQRRPEFLGATSRGKRPIG